MPNFAGTTEYRTEIETLLLLNRVPVDVPIDGG